MSKLQIVGLIASILWLIIIFELVRRRKLLLGYSLIWIFAGLALLIVAFWEDLLINFTHFIGVVYPPSGFFAIVLLILILIVLDLSIKVSKLSDQNKTLAKKVGVDQVINKKV